MANGTISRPSRSIVTGTLDETAFTNTGLSKNGTCSIRKTGGVVQLILDIKKNSGANPYSLTGIIPYGFRPKDKTMIIGTDGSINDISVGNVTGSNITGIYIGTTGYFQGSFTYITEDP